MLWIFFCKIQENMIGSVLTAHEEAPEMHCVSNLWVSSD